MTRYTLSFRARAVREIQLGIDDRGNSFLDELELIFEVLQTMPLRFPKIDANVHRALVQRHAFSLFFRVRATNVVVLAVIPQRADPARWPHG